ncbi:MAG: TIGR04211 family SH3 domain-containing protein [Haliea sp.]|nr:TIGR04211 family SH3 domain-containing protein [Haliea sp.]
MRFFAPFLLLLFLFSTTALAQDIRYVSGSQSVPLRDGPGDDYAIVHRGIAEGSRLTVSRTSEDGLWADITTDSGDMGWIPTAKLVLELSPQDARLAQERAAQAAAGAIAGTDAASAAPDDGVDRVVNGVLAGDAPSATDPAALLEELRSRDAEFNAVAQELHRLKQVSGKAEQLDIDNRRLVEKTENLRSEVDMLQAENRRLLDKVESEDFMNGALAVLLGVIIALVAPRLVPKRRKTSSW